MLGPNLKRHFILCHRGSLGRIWGEAAGCLFPWSGGTVFGIRSFHQSVPEQNGVPQETPESVRVPERIGHDLFRDNAHDRLHCHVPILGA